MRLCLIAALLASACAHAQPNATLEKLRQLTQDKTCTASQQCRSLPLGAKPCGGPEGYLVWSAARADATKVEQLGERYRQERKAEHERQAVASDCRFMTDPGARCNAGTCLQGNSSLE